MTIVIGLWRTLTVALILIVGTIFILLTMWLPVRVKNIPLSAWSITIMARVAAKVLGVSIHCPDQERVFQHTGFVFPNHCSYFDILILAYLLPARFVAKKEVAFWPVIGLIARGIGCVFVNRADKNSRAEARQELAHQPSYYPPIVVYPEGKRNPGFVLLPFRYGAFEVAAAGSVPFLPLAIIYNRPDIFVWHRSEYFFTAAWRLASHRGPLMAQVVVCDPVTPTPEADPAGLAQTTHAHLQEILTTQGQYQPYV
jgi:1-acyl-sn-glycerol-3-phosphate acyltransferase